jgi:hypothetical protein
VERLVAKTGPKRRPLADRFWEMVRKGGTEECWLWTGATTWGYGQIGSGGQDGPPLKAHRVSWELRHGPIPPGLHVCHRCDVRACVNPQHLFLGTRQDNMDDMRLKGRATRGERDSQAKLTAEKVLEIRKALQGGTRHRDLAATYGVSQGNISNIARNKSWRHIQLTENYHGPTLRAARLSVEDVRQIKALKDSATATVVAVQFGVETRWIEKIWAGSVWRHFS